MKRLWVWLKRPSRIQTAKKTVGKAGFGRITCDSERGSTLDKVVSNSIADHTEVITKGRVT